MIPQPTTHAGCQANITKEMLVISFPKIDTLMLDML